MFAYIGNVGPWELILLLFLMPVLLLCLSLYLLPSFIAYMRSKTDLRTIFILNLLLGWTVIGWIISLVWALSEVSKDKVYKDDLTANNHDEWTEVIELANQSGIKPEKLKSFIEMLKEMK